MGLIYNLIVGLVAGWLANKVMDKDSSHLLKNLVTGVVGSFFGYFVAGLVGISASGFIGRVILGVFGAVLLTWINHKFFS